MRADSAVEPTRSENITVTWRRSARSSGLGGLVAVFRSRRPQRSDCIEELHAVPERGNPKLLQVLVCQARENPFVYVIIAEDRLILPVAKAPQPDHNVHRARPHSVMRQIILEGYRTHRTCATRKLRRSGFVSSAGAENSEGSW
jgi:hypothetical protein